jgi:hypothetical protein
MRAMVYANMAAHYLASWDHVESILRHERINEGGGDRLLSLIARLRAAGFDRRLLARRTWHAPLVLMRTNARVIGPKEPVVVFVSRDDRILAFIGTRESFRPCAVGDGTLPQQLTKALSSLAAT